MFFGLTKKKKVPLIIYTKLQIQFTKFYKGVVRELKLPNRVKETLLNTKVKEKDDRLYFTDPTNLPP